jgi:hypothetical protein
MVEQIEFVEEIVKLKKKHPDHEIHFMMDNNMRDDDYSWMTGEITSVKTGVWLDTDWGIKTSISEIEEYFNETDTKYAEFDDSIKPELEKLKADAKPSILVMVN